jgi:hypothetical protein
VIVDNADDNSVLFGAPRETSSVDWLIDWLSHTRKGSIVFTTRTRAAAIRLAESNVIALGELTKAEADKVLKARLLQEHQHQLQNGGIVNEFLDMLAFLVLAIVQAVAFVNANGVALADYIADYQSSQSEAMALLSKEFEDQGRHRDTKNSVATTWYISFKQIQKENHLAADHLSFMACTANTDIPASMLLPGGSRTEQTKAIGTLKAYAFVIERQSQGKGPGAEAGKQGKAFDVHPLLHLAMRGWLKKNDQWIGWAEKAMQRLMEIVPYGDYESREVWTAYLPHAM